MDTTQNGLTAFETLQSFLAQKEWKTGIVDNHYAYKCEFQTKNIELVCFFQIRPDLEQFLFYAVPDFITPFDKLGLVAEYIARVNSGMRIGNFEVDFRDGQIRFKSSINFKGEILTLGLIENTISPALAAMETYLPGLLSVIEGRQTPVRAINSIDYGV
jgi:hypothetical protein